MLQDTTISVAHNDLTDASGFTLSAIMHNEIYFLPDFLEHYRKLGVERFIILDDQSDDGSFEFAAKQPDVMILKSDHRYGDPIIDPETGRNNRAMLAWRQTILKTYCQNQWSLHVDIDEFVQLPNNLTFPKLLGSKNISKPSIIWGAMIDLYPENWSDIMQNAKLPISDVDWFFDGKPHHRKRAGRSPEMIYSGARARLRHNFKIPCGPEKLTRKLVRWYHGNPYQRMGIQQKPILINWSDKFIFRSSHKIKHAPTAQILLPIAHYKFAPNFAARVKFAIESGAYNNASQGYRELRQLYEAMSAQQANFLDDCSLPFNGYENFEKTGNVLGVE